MTADLPRILVLSGDGIGPEVVSAALDVLEAAGVKAEYVTRPVGAACLDRLGVPYSEGLLDEARASTAVLLGAVGDPRYDAGPRHPEEALFALRKALDVYANLRPVRPHPGLADRSPLRPEALRDVDVLIVRELTGGLYYGRKERTHDAALDTLRYTRAEVERVARLAFGLARSRRGRLASVDKANVLETSRLWREVVNDVHASFPDVELEHLYVDNAAMQLLLRPRSFDVLVTENTFGDILSDEAAVLAGGIGLLPSASLGTSGTGLYEPVHGSAPDIAGTGRANPAGAILSAALLLRHGLGDEQRASRIERAVAEAIDRGARTADLGGSMGTEEFAAAVIEALGPEAQRTG